MSDAFELVGLGFSTDVPNNVSTENLWQTLNIKNYQPELFLPYFNAKTRPSDDGLGLYREMTRNTSEGPITFCENIYCDISKWEMTFVNTKDSSEIINVINIDPISGKRTMEFYKRNSSTKERERWEIPLPAAIEAHRKMYDYAAAL